MCISLKDYLIVELSKFLKKIYYMDRICKTCNCNKNESEIKEIEFWNTCDLTNNDLKCRWCVICSKYVAIYEYSCEDDECFNTMCDDCGKLCGCYVCKRVSEKLRKCEMLTCDKYI